MASKLRVIYIGVTNNLQRRVYEHKAAETHGFTRKYKVNRLVYFEVTPDVRLLLVRSN